MGDASRQLTPDEYPAQLREIPSPPAKLWARGSWPPPETKLLSVVGSRALTDYGRAACERLIAGLAGYPISIVSGLALGADACAHKAALRAGLHTIAIPGSGLSDRVIAPRTNAPIAADILSAGGLLLSEHPDEYVPHPHDFPSRNRIMVGISHAVLVIEAAPQSGTLITARLTTEYNRDLLCVPHRIDDPHGYAAHLFLRLGATLIAEPAHILEALGLQQNTAIPSLQLSEQEQIIYDVLETPLSRTGVIEASGIDAADALSALVILDVKGIAKEELGVWRRA